MEWLLRKKCTKVPGKYLLLNPLQRGLNQCCFLRNLGKFFRMARFQKKNNFEYFLFYAYNEY